MARSTTKIDLLASANAQFEKMWKLIDEMNEEQQEAIFAEEMASAGKEVPKHTTYKGEEHAKRKSSRYIYQRLAYTCCKYNANLKISIHKQHTLLFTKVRFLSINNEM